MGLVDRYQNEVAKQRVQSSQKDNIDIAGAIVARAAENKKKIYFDSIVHGIEKDLINRGGGPTFYRYYKEGITVPEKDDVLFVSSVSGCTQRVLDLAYENMQKGVHVIAFTSMEYAEKACVFPSSGKKLHEIAELTIDNCAPAGEAMMTVDGIEAKFAAASGISSDYLLWSITARAIEILLHDGYAPGILKSQNYRSGKEYNDILWERYEKTGL